MPARTFADFYPPMSTTLLIQSRAPGSLVDPQSAYQVFIQALAAFIDAKVELGEINYIDDCDAHATHFLYSWNTLATKNWDDSQPSRSRQSHLLAVAVKLGNSFLGPLYDAIDNIKGPMVSDDLFAACRTQLVNQIDSGDLPYWFIQDDQCASTGVILSTELCGWKAAVGFPGPFRERVVTTCVVDAEDAAPVPMLGM